MFTAIITSHIAEQSRLAGLCDDGNVIYFFHTPADKATK
jgi:hypothetical protein